MSLWHKQLRCTAFEGTDRIASGALEDVVRATKEVMDRGERFPVLIFDNTTSEVIEVDFRGTIDEIVARLPEQELETPPEPQPEAAPRGRGRPRLGVVAREVTLLPSHWDYLSTQPGGASVALRKLVDQAKRANAEKDRLRGIQEAAYRFMSTMAGGFAGFDEAARALFAGNGPRFHEETERWDVDVRDHLRSLAAPLW